MLDDAAGREHVWDRRPRRRRVPIAAVIIVAGGFAAVFVAVLFAKAYLPVGGTPVRLDRLRSEGVVFLEKHSIFVVDGTPPRAFLAASPHGGEQLIFCRSSGLFESPAHGEKFDRFGVLLAGPAPRGMSRVHVRVRRGIVYVDPARVTAGPPSGTPASPPSGPFCRDEPGDGPIADG